MADRDEMNESLTNTDPVTSSPRPLLDAEANAASPASTVEVELSDTKDFKVGSDDTGLGTNQEPFYVRLVDSHPASYLTIENRNVVVALQMVRNALWRWEGARLLNLGTGMVIKLASKDSKHVNENRIQEEDNDEFHRIQSVENKFEGSEFQLVKRDENNKFGRAIRCSKGGYFLHVVPCENGSWAGLGVQRVGVASNLSECALWVPIKQSSIRWRLMCLCNHQYLQVDTYSGNAYTTHLGDDAGNTLFRIDQLGRIIHAKTALPIEVHATRLKKNRPTRLVSIQRGSGNTDEERKRAQFKFIPCGDATYQIVSVWTGKPLVCWLKRRSQYENKYEIRAKDPFMEVYSLWMKVPVEGSYDWLSKPDDLWGKKLYRLNVENDVQDTWVDGFGLDVALRKCRQVGELKVGEKKIDYEEKQRSLLTTAFSPGWAVYEFERNGCFSTYPNAVTIRLDVVNLSDIHMIKGTFVFSANVQVTYTKKEGETRPSIEFMNAVDEKFADLAQGKETRLFGDVYRYEFRIKNQEFNENFELARFPFDVQDITVFFTLDSPKRFPIIYHGKMKFKNVSDEYDILTPTVDIYNTYGKNTKPTVAFRLRVHRKYYWYVLNNMIPIGTMASLTFAGFSVEPEEIGERLAVAIVLLLTAQATKLSVSDHLPKTSTVTVIDKYNLGSVSVVALIILEHIVAFEIGDTYSEIRLQDRFEWIALVVIGVLWILFNGFTIYRVRRRLNIVDNQLGRPEDQIPANIPPRATNNQAEIKLLPGIF